METLLDYEQELDDVQVRLHWVELAYGFPLQEIYIENTVEDAKALYDFVRREQSSNG